MYSYDVLVAGFLLYSIHILKINRLNLHIADSNVPRIIDLLNESDRLLIKPSRLALKPLNTT